MLDYSTIVVIVGKVFDYIALLVCEGYDGALVVSVVVECAVSVCDGKWCIDMFTVGDGGDDIVFVVEIFLGGVVLGFRYFSLRNF